ncbi:39S ribosomal protein L18, mitochondrial [Parelaphostrongylus tenuis]|uniref:39S ribosomal protein L18, mitochondrial n=1 Tax=Parelaphostrongylus tenuis TaxID=148309 RepID=A0AAD5MH08_PARTN|nr:39S ribosomal protein L18, mitochondrial [Parelaphostrongylus tenuis]
MNSKSTKRNEVSFIKLNLYSPSAHQIARLLHYRDGVVIEASTKEKAISNQLYSNTDTCAAMNLGYILAARCLQAGIHFAIPSATQDQIENSKHQKEFFKALEAEGLQLREPAAIEQTYETDRSMVWERYPTMASRQDKLDEL